MAAVIFATIFTAIVSIFFTATAVSLHFCDKLIFDIDIKNSTIKQGAVFRPADNIDLCFNILRAGEIIFLCLFTMCSMFFAYDFSNYNFFITLFIIATIFVVTKNITLKIFEKKSNALLRIVMPVVNFSAIFLYPFVYLVMYPIISATSRSTEKSNYQQFDISPLIPYGNGPQEHTEDRTEDLKILQKALDFTNIRIRECLVPRNEIVAADIKEGIAGLKQKFISSGFSKILIYKNNIDNILGYVNALALFKKPEKISSIMINVIDVPETMTADKLFNLFIKRRRSVAIVIDEFGGTQGMLTIEDIIEEITGEIEDEHDLPELTEKQISNNQFLFSGRLEIDYINEKYNLNLPKSDEYETLAGYFLYLNENIPEIGESVTDKNIKMEATLVKKPKIDLIKLDVIKS